MTLTVMDWFCADAETEILTANGWRRHDQVAVGDLVASLDTTTGTATWVPVQRMNVFDVTDEKMLHIHGKALSAFVTAGHRWPVRQRVGKTGARRYEWQIRTSTELNLESSVVRGAPFATPTEPVHSDAFVELVGWAWTEGSYRANGGIHITQSTTANPGKCERIERALTALYGPAMGRTGRRAGRPAWNASNFNGLRTWRLNAVAAAPFRLAAPDCVLDPAWLRTLTAGQLNLLIDASVAADGTTRIRNGARETTLSQNRPDRADAFQFAAILAGRPTSMHQWECAYRGQMRPMWKVTLLEKTTAKPLRQAVAEWTTHTGVVWCPTVEHGTWLCRRGGLVHWTGNCGAGGSSQGIHAVPGVKVTLAANHWELAIETHAENFPDVQHERGDIRDLPVHRWPISDGFWSSPECTKWTAAAGKKLTYAAGATLPGLEHDTPEADERSRALMWDVVKYLEGVARQGGLVKFGVVENVVEARKGAEWDLWLKSFHNLGYRTKVIAFNSMHAHGTTVPGAPQSRDRLYVAYWHTSLKRDPDWDKWLRPRAWCFTCEEEVSAVQVWKRPGADMGRYRAQYVYRCPATTCRNSIVEPYALSAATAIDWSVRGQRIGDREKPLADKTVARIRAGITKFARPVTAVAMTHEPFMVPAGGTWRDGVTPVSDPMPARTTRENDGIAVPPLLIPVEGRDGKEPGSALDPMRTQTTRNETGLAVPPSFMVELRGGSSDVRAVSDPTATVTASGNHLALARLDALVMRNNNPCGDIGAMSTPVTEPLRALTTAGHQSLLVPYYGNSGARPVSEPVGALTVRDRYGLAEHATGRVVDIDDVLFRMLAPDEISRAMAFRGGYIILGSKRDKVRQLGNAVTPPVAELLISALAEAVTGEPLERRYGLAA